MWGAPEAILVADFEASDKLGKEQLIETRKYDAVTCMFAIHYFFVSRAAITIFLSNVANNLKDGGSFQPVPYVYAILALVFAGMNAFESVVFRGVLSCLVLFFTTALLTPSILLSLYLGCGRCQRGLQWVYNSRTSSIGSCPTINSFYPFAFAFAKGNKAFLAESISASDDAYSLAMYVCAICLVRIQNLDWRRKRVVSRWLLLWHLSRRESCDEDDQRRGEMARVQRRDAALESHVGRRT